MDLTPPSVAPTDVLTIMLPDLSNIIKTFEGMSASPDPGGKAFEYDDVAKKIKLKKLNIIILIFLIIDLARRLPLLFLVTFYNQIIMFRIFYL